MGNVEIEDEREGLWEELGDKEDEGDTEGDRDSLEDEDGLTEELMLVLRVGEPVRLLDGELRVEELEEKTTEEERVPNRGVEDMQGEPEIVEITELEPDELGLRLELRVIVTVCESEGVGVTFIQEDGVLESETV